MLGTRRPTRGKEIYRSSRKEEKIPHLLSITSKAPSQGPSVLAGSRQIVSKPGQGPSAGSPWLMVTHPTTIKREKAYTPGFRSRQKH